MAAPASADSAQNSAPLTALRSELAGALSPSPYWASDHALGRFLAARGGNPGKAATMYRAAMATRAKYGCDDLLTNGYTPPPALAHFPSGMLGLDKQGYPVLLEKIGLVDLIGLQAAVGLDAFLTWVCVLCGRGAACSARRHCTCIVSPHPPPPLFPAATTTSYRSV